MLNGDPAECWIWPRGRFGNGYGAVALPDLYERNPVGAHRAAYRVTFGEQPPGHLHHRCETPACFNPHHLVPLSVRDHHIEHGLVTHCPHGHPYSPENTVLQYGKRRCKTCRREQAFRRYRRVHGIPMDAPHRYGGELPH